MFYIIDDNTLTFDNKDDLLNYLIKWFNKLVNKNEVINLFMPLDNHIQLLFNNNCDFLIIGELSKDNRFKNNYDLYLDIGNTLKCVSKISR